MQKVVGSNPISRFQLDSALARGTRLAEQAGPVKLITAVGLGFCPFCVIRPHRRPPGAGLLWPACKQGGPSGAHLRARSVGYGTSNSTHKATFPPRLKRDPVGNGSLAVGCPHMGVLNPRAICPSCGAKIHTQQSILPGSKKEG
jgi:hypothetical protein